MKTFILTVVVLFVGMFMAMKVVDSIGGRMDREKLERASRRWKVTSEGRSIVVTNFVGGWSHWEGSTTNGTIVFEGPFIAEQIK